MRPKTQKVLVSIVAPRPKVYGFSERIFFSEISSVLEINAQS